MEIKELSVLLNLSESIIMELVRKGMPINKDKTFEFDIVKNWMSGEAPNLNKLEETEKKIVKKIKNNLILSEDYFINENDDIFRKTLSDDLYNEMISFIKNLDYSKPNRTILNKFGLKFKGILKKEPKDHLFITTGVMTQIALKASQDLKKNNIDSGVLHLATVKPLDKEMLSYWIPKVKKIITVEEGLLAGGFGSSILEFCSDNFPNDVHKISRIGLKDSFIDKYGTQELLFNDNNLTKEYLITEMLK
jgi:hypothetical protein